MRRSSVFSIQYSVLSAQYSVFSYTDHASRFTFYVSRFTFLLLLAVLVAGCGSQTTADEPPEIIYGQDICDECGMIISEAEFAASYVTTTGDVRRFESVEDMLHYYLNTQESVHIFWVHDYHTKEWVRADKAVFVLSRQIITPMGGGVVATADQAGADQLVTEGGGTAVTFEQLLKLAQTGALENHNHSEHGHEG